MPFLRHKTTIRELYNEELAKYSEQGFLDVIFMNEKGELTEGARTNLVLRIGDVLCTPPVECGLLGGVFRRSMLDEGRAVERKLYPRDLETASAIYICNSLRGIAEVEFVRPAFLRRLW